MRRFPNGHYISVALNRELPDLFRRKPQLFLICILLLIAVFRAGCSSLTTTTVSFAWNKKDPDVSKNDNITLCLKLLESNTNSTPIKPPATDLLNFPLNYLGRYIEISGTVQATQQYPSQGGLSKLIIGDSSEAIVLGNDGTTVFDTFLLSTSSLTPGSSVTVYGYIPGLRYLQNTQGTKTPAVVIIGRLSPNAVYPG